MNIIRITFLLLLVFAAVSAFAHSTGWGNTSYCGNPPLSRYCVECHDNFALNSGSGSLSLTGLPTGGYTPGQTYTLVVHLAQQGQQRWGFQLTSVKSSNPGRKGGQLINTDAINTALGVTGGLLPDYENHTSAGTRAGTFNGPVTFTFNWQAPVANTGTILFYYVGNAANNSGDPNGDYIYAHVDSVLEASGNHPPLPFSLTSPQNNALLTSNSVTLNWQQTTDPDTGDTVQYAVYFANDSAFTNIDSVNMSNNSYQLTNLNWGTNYYWKVTAYDSHNARTNSSQVFHFATMNYTAPTSPELLTPTDQSLISTDTVRFHWSGGVNPDSGYFILTLQSGSDTSNYTIIGSREVLAQIDTVPGYAINTAMMWWVTAASNYTNDRAVSSTFTLLPVANSVRNSNILPKSLSLSEPSPNPFNPETKLSLTLPKESVVHAELFDINGRLVSIKRWGTLSAGTHNLTIRPEVGSGVYFLRVSASNQLFIRRLALIK